MMGYVEMERPELSSRHFDTGIMGSEHWCLWVKAGGEEYCSLLTAPPHAHHQVEQLPNSLWRTIAESRTVVYIIT